MEKNELKKQSGGERLGVLPWVRNWRIELRGVSGDRPERRWVKLR